MKMKKNFGIINAKIYTMCDVFSSKENNLGIINNGFVLVSDGKIIEVGDMTNYLGQCESTFEANGMSLYPGFVDAHTHLGVFNNGLAFEGSDGNEDSDPVTPGLRALDAVNPQDVCFTEALRAGVTTVLTSPGSANPIAGQILAVKTLGNRVDEMIVKSPVAMKFSLGENPKSVYHDKDKSPVTRMATAALIRDALCKAKKYFIDKKNFYENSEKYDEPEFDFDCEALCPLFDKSMQAHFHAHRADDIFTAIRIAKEFDLEYVIVHGTEGHLIADDLVAENTRVLAGPFLSDRSKPELMNMTPKGVGIMATKGILMAIVTDHPETPIQYLPVCAAIAIREGLSYGTALKSITIDAAKICGIDDRVGSIETGKDADFALFNGDPLLLSNPIAVWCNGEYCKF